jgi:arylsulfatase A-like enzyme
MPATTPLSFDITEDNVRRSRRAYFANISYLDEKVGELVDTLTRTRMLDDTVILFCSDHGDMLGERGLWFKMSFFEGSARVPLMIAGPGITPGLHRRRSPISISPRRWPISPAFRWMRSCPGPMAKAWCRSSMARRAPRRC